MDIHQSKLQGFLIGYALADSMMLNFTLSRQSVSSVVQEKIIPQLGFIHGEKTQYLLQYLCAWDYQVSLDIDEYNLIIENAISILEFYGRPYNIEHTMNQNTSSKIDIGMFASGLRLDFNDMMEWHLTMSYFYYANPQDLGSIYERMSVVIMGAMLWGFLRGISIKDVFSKIQSWRDDSNTDLIGIDDICWWQFEQGLYLRTHNGVHTTIDFLNTSKISSPSMANMIDVLWLIQQGPFLDSIRLILGITQMETTYFDKSQKKSTSETYDSSLFFLHRPNLEMLPFVLGLSAARLGFDSIPFWMREYCGIKETINNFFHNNSLDYNELLLFEHACLEDITQAIIKNNIHNQYLLLEPYKKWISGQVEIPDSILSTVKKSRKRRKKSKGDSKGQLKLF